MHTLKMSLMTSLKEDSSHDPSTMRPEPIACALPRRVASIRRDLSIRRSRATRTSDCTTCSTRQTAPEFVVLSGDQVYVDPTNGLMDPSLKDDEEYELPYENFLRAPAVRRVLKRLPVYAMLDDHEIANNWEPGVRRRR